MSGPQPSASLYPPASSPPLSAPPRPSSPPPSTSLAAPMTSGAIVAHSAGASAPVVLLSQEQTSVAIAGLSQNMAAMQASMEEVRGVLQDLLHAQRSPPQPPLPHLFPMPPPPPSLAAPTPTLAITYPYGMPPPSSHHPPPRTSSVPIHQIQFPRSPSPIPTWAMATSAPIYTSTTPQPSFPYSASTAAPAFHAAPSVSGVLYGGMDGTLIPAASLAATVAGVSASADAAAAAAGAAGADAVSDRLPPKFYKLEFATYDGSEDPLNWLNQCEQFFRGQRTLASDRTWLASYHLKGAAQTWYYALEQDEGMPPWDRFRSLCNLQFGPAVRNTCISELARLPFLSTVQEYSQRFNAVLCHSRNISGPQKAELFVGGLPEHIKVDVELRDPQNLQTAMYLARAFERRAAAVAPPVPSRGHGYSSGRGCCHRRAPLEEATGRPGLPRGPRPTPSRRPRLALDLSVVSPRRRWLNVAGRAFASTVTNPTSVAMCARGSSTWRLMITLTRTSWPPTRRLMSLTRRRRNRPPNLQQPTPWWCPSMRWPASARKTLCCCRSPSRACAC